MDFDRLSSSMSTVAHWRDSRGGAAAPEPDLGEIRARTLDRGVNLPLYLLVRAILVPFFRVYLRLQGIGGEEVPRRGPLLLAANHRSFLDPFVIGALVRRPVYYVAKRELFARRRQAWLLRSLGAFPIDRGRSDEDAMATAKQILSRGDCVVIFPEGTRVRKGPLGAPRRGIGRLALETGAPVVPVAVIGTDQVRRGWRVRPRKVRVRFGRITRLPQMDEVSPSLAAAATGRVWACVSLQWEWLGGQTPPRLESRGRQRKQIRAAPSSERQHAGVRCVE
jgi:1-acyl-sn-glycerol-3-phosphate acyltransferase